MNDDINREILNLAELKDAKRPSASLREHIAEIDAVIAAGVKIETVQETLAKLGFELGPHALRGVLYRYRKERKAQGGIPQTRTPSPPLLAGATKATTKIDPDPVQPITKPDSQTERKDDAPSQSNPWAYKSQLTPEEKEYLSTLSPAEKVAHYRQEAQRKKFTHNPTPERFRKEGE
jgi:hypothetical protein